MQHMQVLDSILSQLRIYRDSQRIRMECADIFNKPGVASLTPQLRPFVRPGTVPQQLLCLQGTIPIYYNGVQYNIPIAVWIVDNYPLIPPVVYVTPTSDMIVAPRHKHVDAAGMCYHPYLSGWNAGSSNLLALLGIFSRVFSEEPPVRSQPPTPRVTTPPNNPPPQYQHPPPYSGPSSNNNPRPTPVTPPSSSHTSPVPTPAQQYQQQQHIEDPVEVVRRNLLSSATKKVKSELEVFYKETSNEIDTLMVESSTLLSRAPSLSSQRMAMLKEIEQAEQEYMQLSDKVDDVKRWIAANNQPDDQFDIDAFTEPKDPAQKQLLHLVADDATIEDALYYLDKALYAGKLDSESYLKQVRRMGRDQFMLRATMKKIHETMRLRAGAPS